MGSFLSLNKRHEFSNIESVLLVILVFSLPLSEALKNISVLFLVIAWIYYSWKNNDFSDAFSLWSVIFLLFFFATMLSIIFASPYPNEWGELYDVFSYLSLAWILVVSKLTKKTVFFVLSALLLSTFIGSLDGYWQWKITHEKIYFELNSVGFTTHTAIYMAIVSSFALFFSIILWARRKLWSAGIVSLCTAFLVFIVVTGESRGAALAFFISVIFLIAIILFRLNIKILTKVALFSFILSLCLLPLLYSPYLLQKTIGKFQDNNLTSITSGRNLIANVSLLAFVNNPILGVGAGNHDQISENDVVRWLDKKSEVYNKDKYLYKHHAHNLYLSTISEKGLIGLISLIFLLGAWAWLVFKNIPSLSNSLVYWSTWGLSVSAFIIVTIAGLFNTTLHHEHGQLAMLGLALFASIVNDES